MSTIVRTTQQDVPDALKLFRWMATASSDTTQVGIGSTEEQAIADLRIKLLNNRIARFLR